MEPTWKWCPECGIVRKTTETICEINGAGCPMDEISDALAQHLVHQSKNANKDDGTLVRVGPIAVGKDKDRWFIKRFGQGRWRRTSYGDTLPETIKRAFQKGL